MLALEYQRRSDLQNVAVQACRADQHVALPHGIDDPVGEIRLGEGRVLHDSTPR